MMMKEKFDEPRLLAMLSEDSHYAFQLLFDRYKNHIYKVAMMYVKSPMIAEEVVQEVFMKVWLNRKQLFAIQSFESWLFTVSKNTVLNYAKKLASEWKASHRFSEQYEQSEDVTDHKVRNNQYAELIHKALQQLPRQQYVIYKMAKEEKLSYAEIGKQLQISPLTVKTHLSRALNTLRIYLREHGEMPVVLFLAAGFC